MRRLWVAGLLIIVLFLLLGCAAEKPAKSSRSVKPIPVTGGSNGSDSNGSVENLSASLLANITISTIEENETNATEGIRVRRLSDEEVDLLRRNTREYEYLRDRRYGTTIDLTQVNGYNCRSVIERLKEEFERLARDVRELDNERRRKEQESNDAESGYRGILASGDEFRIKTARFDWNDAEDEYDEAKKAAKEAHDEYDQTEQTLRILELECPSMRRKAGLRD